MDPVSLTASLITILTAALQTLGGIDKLINLKDDSQRAFGLEKRVKFQNCFSVEFPVV